MTIPEQKESLIERQKELQSLIQELETRVTIIKCGLVALEKGQNMIEDDSGLANNVKEVMCERLIDIVT